METFLAGCSLFQGCDPSVLTKIAPHVEVVEVPAGGLLLRAGAPADALVILRRGRATVALVHAVSGATTTLETLQPGDHAGEVGALLGVAHPYSVLAEEPCVALRLRAELVGTLAARVPSFAHVLSRRLAMRYVQLGVSALRAPPPSTAPGTGSPSVTAPSHGAATPSAPAHGAPSQGPGSGVPSGVIPFVEVAEYDPRPELVNLLPARFIHQHRVLPLRLRGNTLLVGMVSPRNLAALSELQRVLTSMDLELAAISLDDFAEALVRLRLDPTRGANARGEGPVVAPESLVFDSADAEREAEKSVRIVGDEVVRVTNRIVAAAIQREASDVHIEPDVGGTRVRYRVHGVLQDWDEHVPPSFARAIVARLKVLAGLDITERRLPQDGRIGLTAGRRELDLRLSTLPAGRGEKAVLRVLDGAGMSRPLEQIFLEPGALAAVRRTLQRPFGAVVIAGPTGSGKSSTLYGVLNERRKTRPDTNVVLIEDPIEYRLAGVTQVQVNAAAGLGFAQVLRAVLRQDPDVIAIGETRDADTARLALEAGMTGHLMLTSLHANDSAGVIQRLENLGCERPLLAQALSLIVVQRLARRLCQACCRVEPPPPALVESLAARRLIEPGVPVALPRPVGCDACNRTGYAGRVVVLDWLQLSDAVRDALMAGEPLGDVLRLAAGTRAWQPAHHYAAYLMSRKLIAASDALLAVAD